MPPDRRGARLRPASPEPRDDRGPAGVPPGPCTIDTIRCMMSDIPGGLENEQEIQALLTRKLVALINERERELAGVSRVLHDKVGQVLSAAGLQLDVMRM